jgi:hypothetical protein
MGQYIARRDRAEGKMKITLVEVIAPLAVAVVVFPLTLLIIDMFAKTICPERWKIPYVRVAVSVALLGTFVLLGATYFVAAAHVTAGWRELVQPATSKTGSMGPEILLFDFLKILILYCTSWFLDNFPVYVVLPTALVLVGGYTLDRSKRAAALIEPDAEPPVVSS